MKPLIVMLMIAASVHAQSLADAARKERERQAKLRPTRVITSTEAVKPEEPKTAAAAKPADGKAAPEPSKEAPKPQTPPAVDPQQVWNNQLDQVRAKIRTLQDQESALQLQLNQATNQVYAPVTDPTTQQAAVTQVGAIQQQLANVRKDLEDAKKQLDTLQMQGPPKK